MTNKRKISYDYIRVIACICIIAAHCTSYQETDIQGKTETLNYILHSFARIGLPVFFMLSGALTLNSKKEMSTWDFYRSRFIKIIVPFMVYSVFYFVWKNGGHHLSAVFTLETWGNIPQTIFEAIKSTMEEYQTVQLWFMYSIIGIYIVTPFLKVMLQNMTSKQLKELAMVLLVMRCVINYFPQIFGFKIMVCDYIFSNWVMYFILGYIVVQDFMIPYYKYVEIVGLVVYFVSMYLATCISSFRSSNHFDLAPHMMLQAVALFVFFYNRENYLNQFIGINKVIGFVSKYTFSIYLIQFCILTEVNRLPIMNGTMDNKLVLGCIRTVLVFVGSLIGAIIADNTIIKLVQYVCEKIECFYRKIVCNK